MTTTYDVAIVGFGPVGQLLSILLGRAGHSVLVLERWPRPYAKPRAVHFDHEIARIFQAAGVSEAVGAISEPVPDAYEWRNAAGESLVSIDWSAPSDSGWPTANFFSQPDLEAVLDAAALATPGVEVRRGHRVTAVTPRADGVTIEAVQGEQGEQGSFEARWVVGADGANSLVRSAMSATTTDLGFFFDWLICDTIPHEEREWSPMNWQLCDPERPTTLVSGGPGRRRWEFMRLPGETVAELDTERRAWELLEPWGRTPENTTLERHCVYTFQAKWVDRWREGRLVLAGDAAHLMPPFAGQGMCSGLRDAMNLAWKLDLVLRGRADDDLIDTYASERIEHVRHAIGMSMALGQVICVLDPDEAARRDARMIAGGADPAKVLPAGPPPVLGDGVLGHDAAGNVLPGAGVLGGQPRVRRGDREGLLDDVLRAESAPAGPMFVVLTDGPAAAEVVAEGLAERATGLDVRVVPLVAGGGEGGGAGDAYVDLDGSTLAGLRERGEAGLVLRPDFYVYGSAASADGLADLVAGLPAALRLRANALT